MSTSTFAVITDIAAGCGVTTAQVTQLRPLVLIRDCQVFVPGNTAPALAASVARQALGADVDFLGTNSVGHLVYGLARDL